MANLHNPYSKWVKRIWSRNNLVVCTWWPTTIRNLYTNRISH
jgi:hypothetical protein